MAWNTESFSEFGYKLIYSGNILCIKGDYIVQSYDETVIIIRCKKKNICISGANLFIELLNVDEIYIRGNICDISFS